jgi:transcriptional regulator with XRE-family HTH domain
MEKLCILCPVRRQQDARWADSAAELGQYLGEARQRAGLGRDEVAAYFGVPAPYVELIEEGNLQALPDQVHARGYVRSLAVALGLNEEAVTLAVTRLVGRPCVLDRSLKELRNCFPPGGSRPLLRVCASLIPSHQHLVFDGDLRPLPPSRAS